VILCYHEQRVYATVELTREMITNVLLRQVNQD